MSQVGGTNSAEVGSINVGLTADTSGLKSDLRQAEAEVNQSAQRMKKSVDQTPLGAGGVAGALGGGGGVGGGSARRAATGFTAIGQSIRSATAPVRTFLGSITSTVGIVTRFLGVVGLLVSGLGLLKAGFDRVTEGSRKAAQEIESVRAAMLKLREARGERLEDALGSTVKPGIFEETSKKIDDLRAKIGTYNDDVAKGARLNSALVTSVTDLQLQALGFNTTTEKLKEARALMIELNRLQELRNGLLERERSKAESIRLEREAELAAREQQERIERRMREQAKRDITSTTIDISRIGPALDLLQRQRSN